MTALIARWDDSRRRRSLAASVLVFLLGAAHLPAQSGTFRAAAEIVPVFVTVRDDNGQLVPGLTRDVFELRDNGRPQPIVTFDGTPQPIQLVVLIDLSGSMVGRLPLVRRAAAALFARLGEDDAAKVGTFGRDITIAPTFARDRPTLLSSLPDGVTPNAPTPLWGAVREAMAAFDASQRRRVVLVLGDGRDSSATDRRTPFVSPREISERARAADVMIYGVRVPPAPGSLQEQVIATMPDPWLERVTAESGGGHVDLREVDELGAAFDRIMDELRSQYLLGFAPSTRDGKPHRIEVRLSARGLTARARRSYQAPAATAP